MVMKVEAIPADGKRQVARVLRHLKADYPNATCELVFDSPLQLLIATILSAQCTDVRVNKVTKDLFGHWVTADDFARTPIKRLEQAIKSTGFFRNKARNIKAACQELVTRYDGQVPQNIDALIQLPGVGRKTANVVLGTGYGLAVGVVVDTHVGRLSHRLGLTAQKDPKKIEQDLMKSLSQKEWINFSHRMIRHGRRVCSARNPSCSSCSMKSFCPRIGWSGRG